MILGGLTRRSRRRLSGLLRELGVYPYLFVAALSVIGLIAGLSWHEDWLAAVSASGIAGSLIAFFQLFQDDRLESASAWGVDAIFDDRLHHFSDDEWQELVKMADRSFRVLGLANHGYVNKGNKDIFKALFKEMLRSRPGLEIAFLWIDPEWEEMISVRGREEGRTSPWDLLDSIIAFSDEIRGGLEEAYRDRLRLMRYRFIPTCGITWIDDSYMVVTHYLTSKPNLNAPGLTLYNLRLPRFLRWVRVLSQGQSLYDIYKGNLEYVLDRAEEITAGDIDRYKEMKRQLEAKGGIVSEEDRRHETQDG